LSLAINPSPFTRSIYSTLMNMQSLRLFCFPFLAVATAAFIISNETSADIVNVDSEGAAAPVSVDQQREIIAELFGCGSALTDHVPLDYVIQPLPPTRTPFNFHQVPQSKLANSLDTNFGFGFDSVPAEEFILSTRSVAEDTERKSLARMPMMGNSSRRDRALEAKLVSFRTNLNQPTSLSARLDFRIRETASSDAIFEESSIHAEKSYLKTLLAARENEVRRTEWLANALTIGLSTALAFSAVFVAILFRRLAKKQIQP